MRQLPIAHKSPASGVQSRRLVSFVAGMAAGMSLGLSMARAAETASEHPQTPAAASTSASTPAAAASTPAAASAPLASATAPASPAEAKLASLQPTSTPPLLMRSGDGSYVKADVASLPKVVVEQPCYQYNNYWCLKGTQWEGQEKVGRQRLAVFQDPIYAARAIAITMHAYRFKHNLRTPREIMTRYILSPDCRESGPGTAKCTHMWGLVDKYAQRIGAALGIGPNEPMKIFPSQSTVNLERARTLFREMAHIEIGQTLRVPDELIDKGLERAGLKAN